MSDELYEAIARLKSFVMAYSEEREPIPQFIRDVETVVAAFTPTSGAICTPWCTETGQNACSCHERDGSYVCDFCKSQGCVGHMEAAT